MYWACCVRYMLIGLFHCCSRVCVCTGVVCFRVVGASQVSFGVCCSVVKFRRCERYTAFVFLPLSLLKCVLVYTSRFIYYSNESEIFEWLDAGRARFEAVTCPKTDGVDGF